MSGKKVFKFFLGVAVTIAGITVLDAIGVGQSIRNAISGIVPKKA